MIHQRWGGRLQPPTTTPCKENFFGAKGKIPPNNRHRWRYGKACGGGWPHHLPPHTPGSCFGGSTHKVSGIPVKPWTSYLVQVWTHLPIPEQIRGGTQSEPKKRAIEKKQQTKSTKHKFPKNRKRRNLPPPRTMGHGINTLVTVVMVMVVVGVARGVRSRSDIEDVPVSGSGPPRTRGCSVLGPGRAPGCPMVGQRPGCRGRRAPPRC